MPTTLHRLRAPIFALAFCVVSALLPVACSGQSETAMFRGDPQHTGVYLTEGVEEAPSVLPPRRP